MYMNLRLIVLVWNCINIIGAAFHAFLCESIGHGDSATHYLSLADSILIDLIAQNPIQKPDLPLF